MKWQIAALWLSGWALAIQAAQVGSSKPTYAIDLTAPAPAPTVVPENERLGYGIWSPRFRLPPTAPGPEALAPGAWLGPEQL